MKTLEERYNELDDLMKMYFREQTVKIAWDKGADEKNEKARKFNENKKWYQRKKPVNFPHYNATPVQMPSFFPIPPTWNPQYNKTIKLIKEYVESE